jgi:hypothetical protein
MRIIKRYLLSIRRPRLFDFDDFDPQYDRCSDRPKNFVTENVWRRLITTEADIIAVSCYLRHLDDVVTATGVKIGPDNRKEVDRTVKEVLGLEDCPDVWKEVKKRLATDEQGFIDDLHDAFVMKGLI